MITIKKEIWIVKVYEFLTGHYDEHDKPQSLCSLFWTVLITLITSPALAIYGCVGLLSNSVKNITLGKRISGSIGFGVAYIIITALSLMMINDVLGHEDVQTTFNMLGGWVWVLAFGTIFILLLGIAILGLAVLIFNETREWIIDAYNNRKYNKILKAREKGVEVDMSKADWIGFVKNKVCPRVKWK